MNMAIYCVAWHRWPDGRLSVWLHVPGSPYDRFNVHPSPCHYSD